MTSDGRVNAWVIAWQCLNEAVKVRNRLLSDNKLAPQDQDRLEIAHTQMIAESTVAAALASVPEYIIGLGAGTWLDQQYAAEVENAQYVRSAMEDIFKSRDSDSPRDVCAKCGVELSADNHFQYPDPANWPTPVNVCGLHFEEWKQDQ